MDPSAGPALPGDNRARLPLDSRTYSVYPWAAVGGFAGAAGAPMPQTRMVVWICGMTTACDRVGCARRLV
jgi:hypothetical protein